MLSSRSVPWNNDQFTIGLGVNALSGEALTGAFPDPCKLQSRAELDKRPATGHSHAELYLIHRSEDYAKAFGFASDVHGGAYFGGWGVKLADEGCAELQLSAVAHKALRQRGPVEFARRWGTHYINGYKKAVFYAAVINTSFDSSEKRSSASAHVGADVGVDGVGVGAHSEFHTERVRLATLGHNEVKTASFGFSNELDAKLGSTKPKHIDEIFEQITNMKNGTSTVALIKPYSHAVIGWHDTLEDWAKEQPIPREVAQSVDKAVTFLSEAQQIFHTAMLKYECMQGAIDIEKQQGLEYITTSASLAKKAFERYGAVKELARLEMFCANRHEEPTDANLHKVWEMGRAMSELKALAEKIAQDIAALQQRYNM